MPERPGEVKWKGRAAGPNDLLAALGQLVRQAGGRVELDTAAMAGKATHLTARFIERGGGQIVLVVEADDRTDPSHDQAPWMVPQGKV